MNKKDQAYQLLKTAIISGELSAGGIYTLSDLSQITEISSTPTREALLSLESEGLIEPIPRTGYMITPITIRDVLELFHLRKVLEGEAIRLASERITDEDIHLLEQNNHKESLLATKEVQETDRDDYTSAYQLNTEFHLLIAHASGIQRLERMIGKLLLEMERIFAKDPLVAYPQQHLAIIEALKNHNKEAAGKAMVDHIENTKRRLIERF